jgi:VanZ family protein
MSNNGHDADFWMKTWGPVALAATAFSISSTAYFGAGRMNGPMRAIWNALFGPVENVEWYRVIVAFRRAYHFVGYGIIGLMWLCAWALTFPRFRYTYDFIFAVIGTALIASCDEFHQTFVSNRTGSLWDVLLDASGAGAMCPLAYRIVRRAKLGHASLRIDLGCSAEQNLPL